MAPDPTDLDGTAVSGVFAGAALCGECITRTIGIPRWRVADALQRLASQVKIITRTARCDTCHKQAVVHRLG